MFTITSQGPLRALVAANWRYWPTVAPIVKAELRRWDARAALIPDRRWRSVAVEKLAGEHFNAQVAATLGVVAPRLRRGDAVRAIVAIAVMYDYLDGASERGAEDGGGGHLYDAFAAALGEPAHGTAHYYSDLSTDDGGYLADLARACSTAFATLPSAAAVAPVAITAAARCGTAQSRTHLVARRGSGYLESWSAPPAAAADLKWWEYAAGGAASILSVHALISAAATPGRSAADAEQLDRAYLLTGALSTLLDSLVDSEEDQAAGDHSFIAYYADAEMMTERLATIARRAVLVADTAPDAAHHRMTVAGVAGYYLSAPAARSPAGQLTTARIAAELHPSLQPVLALFASWRGAKKVVKVISRRRSATGATIATAGGESAVRS